MISFHYYIYLLSKDLRRKGHDEFGKCKKLILIHEKVCAQEITILGFKDPLIILRKIRMYRL